MSVTYHLVPVDKTTNTFVDFHSLGKNIPNDFSLFAELMFNHSDRFLHYFDKHELVFDFIYSLNESEISKITYEPESLKAIFLDLLEMLKTKEGFPINSFNYFGYEDVLETTFLHVNLKGSELNKIITGMDFHKDSDFDIRTSFDKWNNYSESNGVFEQKKAIVYIATPEGDRYHADLNYDAFPGILTINKTLNNINLGKAITQIQLIHKTPYEHLQPLFTNLIGICDLCIEHNFGIKSFVEC